MLRTLVELNRSDTPTRVAIRNTIGVILPLVIGAATDHLVTGLAISTGAWMTMFSDQPGPYALRIRRVLATSIGVALSAFSGYVIGGHVSLVVPAAMWWAFVGGLMIALGPSGGRVGLNGIILFVITAAMPKPLPEAALASLLIFAGGLLQLLLSIAAWPLQRYKPERHALAQVYRELSQAARQRAPASDAPPVSQSLTDVQLMLYGIRRSSNVPLDSLRVVLELTERIRLEVLALVALQEWLADKETQARIHEALEQAAVVLDAIADALWEDATPEAAAAAVARFDELVATLDVLGEADPSAADPHAVSSIVRARIGALGGMLRSAIRNATYAGSRGELRAMSAQELLPMALRGDDAVGILRANLSFSSVAFRHAVRSAVCIAVAILIDRALGLSHGYWIPMTVAIVLKPDFGGTFSFGLLRVAGTLGGLLLASAILHAPFTGVWASIAILAGLCYGFRVLVPVHYGLAVVMLTSLVVIQLSFAGEEPGAAFFVRAANTAIGSALALIAYLVWPTWERHQVRPTLASMLDSYGAYFLALLHADPSRRQTARLQARMARSNVEDSLKRLSLEPARDRRLFEYTERISANANRFVRALMELEAAVQGLTRVPCGDRIDAFAARVWLTLRMLADALVRDEAPLPEEAREAQRTLVKELKTCGAIREAPAAAQALIYASDRMAESLDTLIHVLRDARQTRPPTPSPPAEGAGRDEAVALPY